MPQRCNSCRGGAASRCTKDNNHAADRESGEYSAHHIRTVRLGDDFDLSQMESPCGTCAGNSLGHVWVQRSSFPLYWRDVVIGGPDGSCLYRISPVVTDEERSQIYSLRYDEYCVKLRSLDPARYPNQQEIDDFDASAAHFIARYTGITVGTIRVTFQNSGRFLMETGEEGFTLPSWIQRDATCEPSRLVGRKINSGEIPIRQSTLLLRAACLWSLQQGYERWVVAWQLKLFNQLRDEGWPFEPLAAPISYHGTVVVPLTLDLVELYRTVFSS